MRRRLLYLDLLILALALAAVAYLLPRTGELALTERPDIEVCLLAAVTAERSAVLVDPLPLHDQLTTGARRHAAAMAARGELAHSNLRTTYAGNWAQLGENVAANDSPATCAPMALRLRASARHYANTTDPRWRFVGVGAVEANGVLWATIAFGVPPTLGPPGPVTTSPSVPLPTVSDLTVPRPRPVPTCTCPAP